jgi:hypothetical protein
MAHRISAAALHLARNILKEFSLAVRPPETLISGRVDKLQATEAHAAIIIDYATNVFHIALLRPEVRYWQKHLQAGTATAPQIANFFSKILDAFALLPVDTEEEKQNRVTSTFALPREFGDVPPEVYTLGKPAREASRCIFYYYDVRPLQGRPDNVLDRHRVAKLAEVSLGLSRAVGIIPVLKTVNIRLKAGKATQIDIRRCMREVGVHLEYIPGYENREEESKLLV